MDRNKKRNFEVQENFLLCWYGEGSPCMMCHTLGEPFALWRTRTRGLVSMFLTLTILWLVIGGCLQLEGQRKVVENQKYYVPLSLIFMQRLKCYQGQHSFYWRYLWKSILLQSYNWFSTRIHRFSKIYFRVLWRTTMQDKKWKKGQEFVHWKICVLFCMYFTLQY